MATTIEVNKQSVKQLLETGKVNKFIIPEYTEMITITLLNYSEWIF